MLSEELLLSFESPVGVNAYDGTIFGCITTRSDIRFYLFYGMFSA